jgi:type II secretory pathway predicted ATPase ExeA
VLATAPLCRAAKRIATDLESDAPWICVGGAPGMGKTSLLRVLPKKLGKGFRSAILGASRIRDIDAQVEARIARVFGLEGDGLSREALASRRGDRTRLVLLVDDAERLSSQSLERLASLRDATDAAGRPLLQVVASADFDSIERQGWAPLLAWADPQWIVRLDPLPPESMSAYLARRMKQAGWKGRSLFSDTAALAVHRQAGGNPGEISRLCSELLDRASADGIDTIDAGFVLRATVAAPPAPVESPRVDPCIEAALAARPLTAESILAAPSLDLAD